MQSHLFVDTTGETCPVPLIETRKALRKASSGQIIEIIGTHPNSKKEIVMAAEMLKEPVIEVIETDNGQWRILIKKKEV
ncbi:MAG: sulfurtransferase TusA family protein [Promethearchaeota archaeon]